MRELNHPHVVRLHEVFYARRNIYLVMELASGGELFDLLTSQPGDRFSEPFAADLMAQMLSAVHYIHSRGVVHRDLKLENFLLEGPIQLPPTAAAAAASASSDGGAKKPRRESREAAAADDEDEGGASSSSSSSSSSGEKSSSVVPMAVVKLIDFGLSKHFHHHEIMQQQVGSAYYVAPEVLRGRYNEACDMWSMGVILYMLVSGVPPFWGRSDAEIRQRTLRGKYSFPSRQFQHVSEEAMDLIRRLLELDPTRRITAAEALRHPWVTKAQRDHVAAAEAAAEAALNAAAAAAAAAGAAAGEGGGGSGDGSGGEGMDMLGAVMPSHGEIASSLRQFTDFSAMRKLMLEVVAFTLSASQIAGLREEFEALDTDKSGTLSVDEVRRVFRRAGNDKTFGGGDGGVGGGGSGGGAGGYDGDGDEGGAGSSSSMNLEEEIDRIFDAVSVHHGHSINYTEFIAATVRIIWCTCSLHQYFRFLY